MDGHPLALADQARVEQFRLLGRACRLFMDYDLHIDKTAVAWAVAHASGHGFAVTWLGPGWAFDPHGQQRFADELLARKQAMMQADTARHRAELNQVIQRLHLGRRCERLLWAIDAATLKARRSLLHLPHAYLAEAVWGREKTNWPRHWLTELREMLTGLTWLHVFTSDGTSVPSLGTHTSLLADAANLRGNAQHDQCDESCPYHGGARHHHFLVNVAPGFLGILEQFAQDSDAAVREYQFRVHGKKNAFTLRKAGKTGQLVSVYMPARLGELHACSGLSDEQHRLLQAVVRETTRKKVKERRELTEPEIIVGNKIRTFTGKKSCMCSQLDPQVSYVGFNGNGKRKGLGYYLATWMRKAGYAKDQQDRFLRDIAALEKKLGLIVVGVQNRFPPCMDRDRLRVLASMGPDQKALNKIQVRIYAPADYIERWNKFFGWGDNEQKLQAQESDPTAGVKAMMVKRNIAQRALAAGVGVDPSFFSKVLKGRKPWPAELLHRVRAYIDSYTPAKPESESGPAVVVGPQAGGESLLPVALDYLARGWSVVPQRPGAKQPCVKWKPFQSQLPTEAQMAKWFELWPDAGVALVLGPVSGVFAIDVDGEEAHAALLERLGTEPVAVKALSGSREPCRYHLFFRHPDVSTNAKATPWNAKLEFRGQGGIVVIPPSLHKSGNRYEWATGRSPGELALPDLPDKIVEALKPAARQPAGPNAGKGVSLPVPPLDMAPSTREFLEGKFADGPRWNDRLFRAACDLAGRGLPIEEAEPLLLAGAQPWDSTEAETARRTITSAFGQPRDPGYV
jgi:hypothetical protein